MDTKSKFFSPVSPAAGAWQRFAGRTPESESFYRNRWRSDKVVRSIHGVNCTGSCSRKIYVKDGLVGESGWTCC
jgi:nitrate reductase / nitrite oxidoreductase, alpha subunit